MYVIKRVSDGRMVSKPGSMHSYTHSVMRARLFDTIESAEADRCVENEYISQAPQL